MIVVFIVLAVVVVGLAFVRLRAGGPGPAVNWIPRPLRGRLNKSYQEHGWQEPFDDNGDRNPDRDAF